VRAVGARWSAIVGAWKSGGIVLSSAPFDEGGVGGAQPRSNVASLADTDGATHALAPMNESDAATYDPRASTVMPRVNVGPSCSTACVAGG
jgi:hypothetical protein